MAPARLFVQSRQSLRMSVVTPPTSPRSVMATLLKWIVFDGRGEDVPDEAAQAAPF